MLGDGRKRFCRPNRTIGWKTRRTILWIRFLCIIIPFPPTRRPQRVGNLETCQYLLIYEKKSRVPNCWTQWLPCIIYSIVLNPLVYMYEETDGHGSWTFQISYGLLHLNYISWPLGIVLYRRIHYTQRRALSTGQDYVWADAYQGFVLTCWWLSQLTPILSYPAPNTPGKGSKLRG